MKKIIILFTAAFLLALSNGLYGQKTAELWYWPALTLKQAITLVDYDMVVVDHECALTSRESLDYLRKNHPGIKILCYFNAVEWHVPMYPDKFWSMKMLAELKKDSAWWLTGVNGHRLGLYPGMFTMNCCWDSPRIGPDGQNYIEFVTSRYKADILSSYPFDGVLKDNLWTYPANWFGKKQVPPTEIDRDHDGRPDKADDLNKSWQEGMDYCLKELRQFGGKNFLIIGNPGDLCYRRWLDGVMLENFPDVYRDVSDKKHGAWYKNMRYAASFKDPCIFNARKDNYFFTLCSSVLVDGAYFSYQQNTPYDKKYQLNLGQALGKMRNKGKIYQRSFQKGTVYIDPERKISWIKYSNGTERRK